MDPTLIDAEDKHRAQKATLRSPDFRRMVGLAWPHRRFILVGLLASVVYGFLHSVSVVGVLPVLKVLLADEGFHGWVYRTVAEDRLDVAFDTELGGTYETLEAGEGIGFLKVSSDSPLAGFSVGSGDRLVAVDGGGGGPRVRRGALRCGGAGWASGWRVGVLSGPRGGAGGGGTDGWKARPLGVGGADERAAE